MALLCVCLSFTEIDAQEAKYSCAAPWEEGPGGRCFIFSQDKKTFKGAQKQCGLQNGRLVEIRDPAVYNFIQKRIRENSSPPFVSQWSKLLTRWGNGYWVGGRKGETTKKMEWLTRGTSVTGSWLKGQPDKGMGLWEENCLLQMLGGWNDYPCGKKTRYICESGKHLLKRQTLFAPVSRNWHV